LTRPNWIVVLLGLVSIGALAALAFYSVRLSSETTREQARVQVSAAAAASSIAIQQELRGAADVVSSVATRPSLIAALGAGGASSVDVERVRSNLDALLESRQVFDLAFVTDAGGTLIDVVPAAPSVVGRNFSYRDWYRGVTESGQPYVSEAYETAAPGVGLVVAVAAPVQASADQTGPMVGILVVVYRLDSIEKFLDEFSAAQGVRFTVADQRGMLVVSPEGVPTELVAWSDDPEVAEVLASSSGTSEERRDGRDYIQAHAPISDLGWALIAEMPKGRTPGGWIGFHNAIIGVTVMLGLAVLGSLVLLEKSLRRRVKVDEELRRSQAFLDSVIENIPTMVFVKDAAELRFVRINRAGEELLGHPREEMLGRSDFDIFPPEEAELFVSNDREILERGELIDIPAERVRTGDGDERILHTRKIPICDPQGRAEYLLGISHDVTEEQKTRETLDVARRTADLANRAKSDFVSRMSHEFRTPLNAVLGFGQLLQLDGLTGEQLQNVDHIMGAGRHLLALIDEVLDLRRVETGQLQLSLVPVQVADVVDEAVSMMRPLAEARDLRTIVDTSACEKVHVRADRQRLKQVCVNLLANAVKYNCDGGDIRISLEAVDEGEVRLTVSDTGMGIAEHDLSRLFVPFERLGAQHTTVEGTGLGLTLTKQLVEAMAGEIGVTSTVGSGTSFWVQLPKVAAPVDTFEVARGVVVPATHRVPATSTILYIEDNTSNLKLLEQIVATRPNVTLLPAMLGQIGLDVAYEHLPTLILLDLHLPDMSGEEVLRRLRTDQRTATTPIVVLSADATPGNLHRLLEAGATEYMTKPFDIPRLLSLIDRHAAMSGKPADRVPDPGPDPATTSLDASTVAALRELADLSVDGAEQLRQLVELFLHDTASRLAEIVTASRDGDHERIADLAHSLAGSCANLGAGELSDVCRGLEREARVGQVEAVESKLATMLALFAEARIALHDEFLSTPETASR
jgi:PAS domain S-box-containing protein